MLQILIAILGLSLLVIVHEAGHYFVARAFGIQVVQFSIGIGPVVVKYRPRGSSTVFLLRAIPFMAYVMYMDPADAPNPQDRSLYPNASVLARTLTVCGGPVANYLTATLLIFGLAISGWRIDVPTEPMVIDHVAAGSPAASAGLRSGDVIVEANGKAIRNLKQLIEVTAPRAGQATSYVIRRAGQPKLALQITPRASEGRGTIGVSPREEAHYQPLPVGAAAKLAVSLPWLMTVRNLEGMADLIRRHSTEGITGPVGMGKLVAEQAGQGTYAFIWILVSISVALGYFNLLPFPALDGGKLLFLGYEMITRRRPNQRVEAVIHTAGLLFLLGVIALVTLRDVV